MIAEDGKGGGGVKVRVVSSISCLISCAWRPFCTTRVEEIVVCINYLQEETFLGLPAAAKHPSRHHSGINSCQTHRDDAAV